MAGQEKDYEEGFRAYHAQEYDTAYRLLIRFAEQGDGEAQTAIGSIHQLGLGGRPINFDEAVKWYVRASEQGNGLASNGLGTISLQRGDREAAVRWYEKARQQGFAHSPSADWVRKNY